MTMKDSPGGLLGPLRVVLCNGTYVDPAVDLAKLNADPSVMAALVEFPDVSRLPLKEGGKPMVWTLDRLTVGALSTINTLRSNGEATDRMRSLALLSSLRSASIEGEPPVVEVLQPGSKDEREGVFVGHMRDGMLTAPQEALEFIRDRWGWESVCQIGQHALDFARLPRGARSGFRYWAG